MVEEIAEKIAFRTSVRTEYENSGDAPPRRAPSSEPRRRRQAAPAAMPKEAAASSLVANSGMISETLHRDKVLATGPCAPAMRSSPPFFLTLPPYITIMPRPV